MWSATAIVLVDRSDHRHAVAVLALELGISADDVDVAYRRELERLGSEARIQDFVPLLAARKVRSVLKRKASHSVGPRIGNGAASEQRATGLADFAKLGWRLPTLKL